MTGNSRDVKLRTGAFSGPELHYSAVHKYKFVCVLFCVHSGSLVCLELQRKKCFFSTEPFHFNLTLLQMGSL